MLRWFSQLYSKAKATQRSIKRQFPHSICAAPEPCQAWSLSRCAWKAQHTECVWQGVEKPWISALPALPLPDSICKLAVEEIFKNHEATLFPDTLQRGGWSVTQSRFCGYICCWIGLFIVPFFSHFGSLFLTVSWGYFPAEAASKAAVMPPTSIPMSTNSSKQVMWSHPSYTRAKKCWGCRFQLGDAYQGAADPHKGG